MVALGYIRVSTTEQCTDGVSLDNQKSKIVAYCQLRDLPLSEIIEDAGISAKNLHKRPGAQKVLALARKKQIDAVVVYKLDRMFRSTIDALETTKMFERHNVSFHSISENIDSRSPIGKFFFTLTAALAEMERNLIGERTKSALDHKRSKSEKTGGYLPYGFDLMPEGLLIKNESEQRVIKTIHRLNKGGYSLRKICRELENQGYTPRRGNEKWQPSSILKILKRNL
jgi:site-specific DNA recombinase